MSGYELNINEPITFELKGRSVPEFGILIDETDANEYKRSLLNHGLINFQHIPAWKNHCFVFENQDDYNIGMLLK